VTVELARVRAGGEDNVGKLGRVEKGAEVVGKLAVGNLEGKRIEKVYNFLLLLFEKLYFFSCGILAGPTRNWATGVVLT
jgi:hypothetical protein